MSRDPDCMRCGEAPTTGLLHGIDLFNTHQYFTCHEVLEAEWNAEHEVIRTVYKGILQVGVGCYHLLRGNYRGAVAKLEAGANYLEPFGPICWNVDLARLITDARQLLQVVIAAGPANTASVDRSLLPIIQLVEQLPSEQ